MTRVLRHAIPNGLSLARLALGVAFPWLPVDWRLGVIAAAAATDFLDGLTARWLGAESEFGRLLDPVADKVFVLVLAGTLLAEGSLAPGWAAGVAARDVVVLVGVLLTAVRGDWARCRSMRPTLLGKVATAWQFALLLVLVARGGAWVWLLAATTGFSGAAGIDYARRFLRPHPTGDTP